MMRNQSGQAILIAVALLGSILALVVVWGSKRQGDVSDLVGDMEVNQSAVEALSSAARRVQRMYSLESGCDPDVLDTRLSRLQALPASAASFDMSSTVTYATAQPGAAALEDRQNRCTTATGCRQIGIPLEKKVYVVTVGAIATEDKGASVGDCPRDATVRLSVAANGNLYHRRVTLVNICTLASCPASNANSFDGIALTVTAGAWASTTACTGAYWTAARRYGSITSATTTAVSVNDLRWARRYMETGAGDTGDTTYADGNTSQPAANQNYSCSPAQSASQCTLRYCVPPFDLNRDKTNNDADLAIFEFMLRGYLLSLPVVRLN